MAATGDSRAGDSVSFKIIDLDQAKLLLDNNEAIWVDIRDPQSYEEAHVKNATNLSDQNIQNFLDSSDKSKPVVCYCYHGISSQNASTFLAEQGFTTVYSLEGGFEAWRSVHPYESK
jgi:thiosulfate sulfurtransferase